MNRYFFYIAAAAALLSAACTKEPLKEEEPVIPVTGITLNPCDTVLLVGATLILDAAVEPAGATNQTVTWNTSDDRVATVNPAGELTAVAAGTATITVCAGDGGFTATCTVIVTKPNITMTTQAGGICLEIYINASADNFVNFAIHWGDGNTDATRSSGSECYVFHHYYSDKSEHRIVISGDNIEGLYCYENHLTALDVSGATALEYLYCHKNQLIALDVSGNTALKTLDCSRNQITSLNVSGNTALKVLECYENQLIALDVSGATALVDLAVCMNRITNLDVSANTALHSLCCNDNQLTVSALDDLFGTLPYTFGYVEINNNPGELDCDRGIAEKKGWIFDKWHWLPIHTWSTYMHFPTK